MNGDARLAAGRELPGPVLAQPSGYETGHEPGSARHTPGHRLACREGLGRHPTSRRVVALTFCAGANADAVPSILAALRREGVPANFFLIRNFVRDFPAAARSIAAAGFRIGDHTVSHPYLTRLSNEAVRQESLGAARQITAVTATRRDRTLARRVQPRRSHHARRRRPGPR